MNVSLFLARKISLSSEGEKSSPAVKVAIAAVALSVLVMMGAIAIVMGFKDEITRKVASFNSHIQIYIQQSPSETPDPEANIMTLSSGLQKALDESPYVEDYTLQASAPAILKTNSDFKGIYLKSLSGAELRDFISSSLIQGSVPDYSLPSSRHEIVISEKTASSLGLKPGDKINTYFITDRILVRPLIVKGIFNSHFEAYDDAFIYGALPLVQEIGELSPKQGTSVAVSVNDFSRVSEISADLQERLIADYSAGRVYSLYRVESALQSGSAYFSWLSLLDMNVIVVLALMTVVACVTLVSGMLILMVDKIRFIALLSALGASRRLISRIFMLLAARIALIGLLIGDGLALTILYIQDKTHVLPLDPDSYYIDFVPCRISFPALILLNLGVMSIIWIILLLPSRFAGKAAPASTLSAD